MDLRGSRVSIRAWQRHDDELADEWPPYHDPLDPLWNLPRPLTLEAWGSFLDSGSLRRTSFAVVDRSDTLIGRISLREIDERKQQARLGITFGAPYVGQGLGTEALTLFLDYYFGELGYQTMVLDVAAPNVRAVRCYHRLGFRYVESDYRDAGPLFDRRVLDMPAYTGLRRYFRADYRGLKVEFFEMRLDRPDWLAHRQSLAAREHG